MNEKTRGEEGDTIVKKEDRKERKLNREVKKGRKSDARKGYERNNNTRRSQTGQEDAWNEKPRV